jgi:hypothetical protein
MLRPPLFIVQPTRSFLVLFGIEKSKHVVDKPLQLTRANRPITSAESFPSAPMNQLVFS